jgi:hypothetical protein
LPNYAGKRRRNSNRRPRRRCRYRTAWNSSRFIGFEAEATAIRFFHPLIVPGLLQTDEYAVALSKLIRIEAGAVGVSTIDLRTLLACYELVWWILGRGRGTGRCSGRSAARWSRSTESDPGIRTHVPGLCQPDPVCW